ncbi:TPA: conjugal transfer protein TraI [Escherichia coli]|nr:conjugal transfer protein TraI [Escherichia coli]
MSLNPRDLTQGGQVAFMRLKMFLQINNLISYYVIMGTVLFGIAVLLMRISIQNLTNGIIYWFVRMISPFTEKMVSQSVYTIRYYEHKLQYSARQILNDDYTVYCGQLLKQELIIAGCAALLVAFVATFAVYALTVYGVQGASERFAIALTGTEGGRKRMASLESTYVTLSRAKEHVQVYTDNLEDWQQQVRQSDGGKNAHDLLHEKSDRESDTGNRLLATASRLDKTALGRRVLAENGLEGETMARFIAAGKKYPSPYVALPVWTRHGKEAGALLTEIRIEDDGMRVVLSEESRLRGGEDAQFAGLQASRNGQTLIADSADAALRLAQENPESGVVIRLHGEERLLNAARLTGGRITEPDELSRALRNVADAETAAKAEDPITLPPDEQQKLAEVQEKAARELAEQARRELLSVAPQKDEEKRDLLLSADDERRLRDGTERESRELDEAVREAVAGGRGARQQVREQMQRTEREWVVKMPEKEIEMEKTLGGD